MSKCFCTDVSGLNVKNYLKESKSFVNIFGICFFVQTVLLYLFSCSYGRLLESIALCFKQRSMHERTVCCTVDSPLLDQ